MIKKFLGITFLSAIVLIGCTNTGNMVNSNSNLHMGIIETTGQSNETYLTLLDQNLKIIKREKIELGSMGSPFDLPRIFNGSMYVVPKGLITKDLTVVFEYGLSNGNTNTYDVKQHNINTFAVDENFLYTANTLNMSSIITKCNKSTNKLETLNINNVYISRLDAYDNTLYAFGEEMNDEPAHKSFLYLIDPVSLKINDIIDITECGTGQYYSLKINDKIYFTNQYDIDGNPGYKLSVFDINNKKAENYELKSPFPYQIFEYNNKLLISHYDLVQNRGNDLTIFDPTDHLQKLTTFKNSIGQIYVFGNTLYSADLENLYVYNLENFKLEKTIDIYSKRNEKMFFYFSSFFIKP
ncbi:hypothetical protein [Sporanaerobacter sp. PP17-6a]|uniref:hypothetical protein n=1 Tax=Sporanaerobacter sp. PP17-6a TaxID=1891289 RepID=UPI0008A060A0|nr:hypothetical protein [Sporanaerobacter sp. PP17-6a]SCL85986.1 hypothetical protein PP176A_0979 [Sporanaerobacter sp. PP17-6a]